MPPSDALQDVRTSMVLTLLEIGIAIEAHHHEVATGGQGEIDMRFATLRRMADNVMIYKYVVKNIARERGMTATFMPKPLFGDNGSGMHVHQSLWRETGRSSLVTDMPDRATSCATTSAGCSSTLRRSSPSAPRPSTPIGGWCRDSRRR